MLMEHSRVAVPEMGTFILQFDQAFFGNDHKSLHPPRSKIYFSPSVDSDFILSSLLTDDGMDKSDAYLVESLLIKDYLASVSQQKPFEFNGLGTLVNNLFIPKNEEYFNRYSGLKEISAKIVQKGIIKHNETFQYYLKQPITKIHNAEFYSLLWPILIAIITILSILFWVISRSNETYTTHEVINSISKVAGKSSVESIYQKIDSNISNQKQSENKIDSETLITEEVKDLPSHSKKPNRPDAPIINQSEFIENSKADEIKKCIIIIGAFSDIKNADKLAVEASSKGYEVFRQNANGMNRVGIRYNCEKKNTEMFRSKIREIFNEKAWYLHDTL